MSEPSDQKSSEMPAPGPNLATPKLSSPPIDLDWLETFYKECGREVTLAYTTLNQMKNFAMIIAGAVLSGVSFGAGAQNYPSGPMFVGVVIAYAITLRFFVRAILCYINLIRWNRLQSKIVNFMLLAKPKMQDPSAQMNSAYAELRGLIQSLY